MLLRDRFEGCLIGLAVGDALGTTVEFSSPGSFEPVTDMVGGGVFGLKAGEWTDDTSMALCLAESLVRQQSFDPADQMRRYMNWYQIGYMSSTGSCFDIGGATRSALERFARTGEAYSGSTDPMTAGNGSIMRLAPVAMAYALQPSGAVHYAGLSSRTTHAATESVEACEVLAAILVAGFHGADKATMLSPETMKRWRKEKGVAFHLRSKKWLWDHISVKIRLRFKAAGMWFAHWKRRFGRSTSHPAFRMAYCLRLIWEMMQIQPVLSMDRLRVRITGEVGFHPIGSTSWR